jgi:hypothetical protein
LIFDSIVLVGADKDRIIGLDNDRDAVKGKLKSLDIEAQDSTAKLNTLGTNYKSLYEHYTNSMTAISEAIRKLNGKGKQGASFGGKMSGGGDVGLLRADHEQLRTEGEVLQQINRSTQVTGLSNMTAPWRAEVDLLKRKLGDLEGNSGQMFVHKD